MEKTLFTCDRCQRVSGEDLADWHDLVPRREDSDKPARTLCPDCVEAFMEEPVPGEDGITRDEAKALHVKATELAAEARKQARAQLERRAARDQVRDQDEGHTRLAADARQQAGDPRLADPRQQAASPGLDAYTRRQAETGKK